jgi:DNA-binding transcriptional LysR family regulator
VAVPVDAGHAEPADRRRCLRGGGRASAPGRRDDSISTLYAHVRAGGVGAVVAHAWLHLYPVPAGMRAVPLVRPDVRQSIGLVWPDHRAEPLLTRALITTVREVDLVAVLDRSAASGR